jgi:cell division protein FtsL
MERELYVPAKATDVHLPRCRAGHDNHSPRTRRLGGRDRPESTRPQRQTPRMAKRRVGTNWRLVIALLLVGFVLITTGVIARRVYGVGQERRIRDLQRKRNALEADRIRLEGAIRDGSSRARLEPIAEQRLNMHIPKPGQQVILTRPPRDSGAVRVRPRVARDTL